MPKLGETVRVKKWLATGHFPEVVGRQPWVTKEIICDNPGIAYRRAYDFFKTLPRIKGKRFKTHSIKLELLGYAPKELHAEREKENQEDGCGIPE